MSTGLPIELVSALQQLALANGASLTDMRSFHPMAIEHRAKNDFSRGALAAIFDVYYLACKHTDSRQAAFDLGFELIGGNTK